MEDNQEIQVNHVTLNMHVIGEVVGNVETSCFDRGTNGNADYDSRFVKNENGTCQDAGSKGVVCSINASCD